MANLREAKKAAQRAQILSVCSALFRQRGYDETTISDITAGAGISRQTFFNYFTGKDAVLAELGLAWLNQQAAVTRIDTRKRRDSSILAGTRRNILAQLAAVEADRAFMKVVFTRSGLLFPTGENPAAARAHNDQTRPILDGIALVMQAAQETGEVRTDITPLQIAEIYVSQMLMTIRFWLVDYWQDGESLQARAGRVLDVIESGLATAHQPSP